MLKVSIVLWVSALSMTAAACSEDGGASVPDATQLSDTNVVADAAAGGDTGEGGADTASADTSIADIASEDTAVADAAASDISSGDTAVADTAAADTGAEDASVADTAVADTGVEDTAVADTAVADTGFEDTAVTDTTIPADTAAGTCGCGGGGVCLQAKTASACTSASASCTSPQQRVDACATADVMASCERESSVQYLYFARVAGWVANLAESCASTLAGPAGTLAVAETPAGVGSVCSCQRTAAACVQTYGDLCAALTCDTATVQPTACAAASRVPGRCVTRDGQREIVFYAPGTTPSTAENACLGASATNYYWFPAL